MTSSFTQKSNQKNDAYTPYWYQLTTQEIEQRLQTSNQGLSHQEAAKRLIKFGSNTLPEKKQKNLIIRFLRHFNDALIYILLIAALITGLMGHLIDTIVILGVTIINALIGFVQENKAQKSLKSIHNMLSNQTIVIRQGTKQEVNTTELVLGDIVALRPGAKIPADLRLFDVHNLQIEEAILTGESTVIQKHTKVIHDTVDLADQTNMAFSGTTVSAGTGYGIVIATGSDTQLGYINQMMNEVAQQQTPLLKQMNTLGKNIFLIILALMFILFIIGYFIQNIALGELSISLISLAVAAVPEGLPAIISIILSLGVQNMAKKRAIIRKLPIVETLSAMTVICSDKTGTLTMNEMTVKTIILANSRHTVTGESYEPTGQIIDEITQQTIEPSDNKTLSIFLTAAMLCNDSQINQNDDGQWQITGGPTEAALKVLSMKSKLQMEPNERVNKIPFDSKYKYMSTLNKLGDKKYIFLTGAPDVLFHLCQHELGTQGKQPFREDYWEKHIEQYAQNGLRMIAAAYKEVNEQQLDLEHRDISHDMILIGLAGMMDPPRPEAIEAIKSCQNAGIRVKMITGDHQETAMAIGAMLNIGNGKDSITGHQLESMDDQTLEGIACQYDIFARTSPEHKLRLVKALQENGEIVGMTGDGVNDAPALKQAEVGIAMGIKGTEVTKEAADMVLVDDNFATIANAIKEGRRVYDNLKKTILFILPTNLAQGLLIIIAIILGMATPLTPLQILWMNMATSTTLSFGLASEQAEHDIMDRPPKKASKSILDLYAVWRIIFVGLLIAYSAFLLEAYLMRKGYPVEFIRTVLLQTLVTAQWAYMFNCRKQKKCSLDRSVFKNKGIWIVSLILIILQLGIIYLPTMNHIFGTVPLPAHYWIISLLVGFGVFIMVEIEKYFIRKLKIV